MASATDAKLPAREPFAQKDRAEQDIDERRHEITETRFDDAPDVDRPNELEPVQRDHQSAAETKKHGAPRAKMGFDFVPASLPGEKRSEKERRPNKSVRDNFGRGNRFEQFQ